MEKYGVSWLEETGAVHQIQFGIMKDTVSVYLDTSGVGLHKRGYRTNDVAAPIKETLASAMVQLSFWKEGRLLVDPCCGSGTIPIEAAMIGRNIAPGLTRSFACEEWELIPEEMWKEERQAAYGEIKYDADIRIKASDIDKRAIQAAQDNAIEAGVDDCIEFSLMNVSKLESGDEENGIIITNPPYGTRIGDEAAISKVYKALNFFMKNNKGWSLFMITTDKEVEKRVMGREADRRRKLYNGRLEVCYYQFHGKKQNK